jgi:hypothetical protein
VSTQYLLDTCQPSANGGVPSQKGRWFDELTGSMVAHGASAESGAEKSASGDSDKVELRPLSARSSASHRRGTCHISATIALTAYLEGEASASSPSFACLLHVRATGGLVRVNTAMAFNPGSFRSVLQWCFTHDHRRHGVLGRQSTEDGPLLSVPHAHMHLVRR